MIMSRRAGRHSNGGVGQSRRRPEQNVVALSESLLTSECCICMLLIAPTEYGRSSQKRAILRRSSYTPAACPYWDGLN